MDKKVLFDRVFVPNKSLRFDDSALGDLGKEVIFVCDAPLFDSLVGKDETKPLYEGRISSALDDFDSDKDVIVDFGDPFIFAMMIYFLADSDKISVARYSKKAEKYTVKEIKEWW